jgi:hypothetical protein
MRHCFLNFSSNQGTFRKAKWQSASKCPLSHGTLKTRIASRILTPTGGTREGKGLGCRELGGERGGIGALNSGFFGPAVRHLGFRAKMALRGLRRRIVRLEGVFGG